MISEWYGWRAARSVCAYASRDMSQQGKDGSTQFALARDSLAAARTPEQGLRQQVCLGLRCLLPPEHSHLSCCRESRAHTQGAE